MAFLELTAPPSPIPESASTISSEDNKMVALIPPAPAPAETTNTTSSEVAINNTDKVSLPSSVNDHELKEPKAFDQMIAHLNAMRAKVQALESENNELKDQVDYEKSSKEHLSKELDDAKRNWQSAEFASTIKVRGLECENNSLKAQVEREEYSKENLSKDLDEAKLNWHTAELEAAAKVQVLKSENTELKAQVEIEKSSKEQFSKNLDEANNNARAAELEAATKTQTLESKNNDLMAQVEHEKTVKEHYFTNLEEANNNWHSAQLEATAKDAELGRVRERLHLVEAQAAEQEQLHAVKEQNIEFQARFRLQFILTTHQHVQTLKHMMHDWKMQVEQKIDEEYENNKLKENDADAALDAEYERLKALIEGHEYIITNIKKGNQKFVAQIKQLREAENVTLISDLTADRFEAFLNEREKMVAQLEQEKQEFVDMVNEN
ncbi:hypothetical protein FPCIR_13562 [Fusarium pseudocircinatum]|uniref:Uncharacterized protein n=1 Tax=Fusarium pseudocircinatum TaxID=56676 RepID=A0A8H5KMC1_9HYPO|nr:hypothetical protein FPCIR_13562 [Fusarium pseudocircinatum]